MCVFAEDADEKIIMYNHVRPNKFYRKKKKIYKIDTMPAGKVANIIEK